MPTERFTKLREEKKKRISEAVIGEFQRTSYGELQMSKIARSARISRGSLYTYFRDKEDMFLFAMSQTWRNLLEQNRQSLLEHNGDFWAMQMASLRRHFIVCKSNQIYRLLYLVSGNEEIPCELFFLQVKDREYQEYKKWIYLHVKREQFHGCTEEEFGILQDTCQSLLMVSIQQYLLDVNDEKKIAEDFSRKLQQIKKAYIFQEVG